MKWTGLCKEEILMIKSMN